MNPKVLIFGNHTCANRGDAAILRGLITYLKEHRSDVDFELMSRYPEGSEILLGEEFHDDSLYRYNHKSGGLLYKVKRKFTHFVNPIL